MLHRLFFNVVESDLWCFIFFQCCSKWFCMLGQTFAIFHPVVMMIMVAFQLECFRKHSLHWDFVFVLGVHFHRTTYEICGGCFANVGPSDASVENERLSSQHMALCWPSGAESKGACAESISLSGKAANLVVARARSYNPVNVNFY
jgi:hypothetical protein